MINISPEQKLEFEVLVRKTKDKNEYTRLCVILAKSEGMSPNAIAQALRISISSVYQYLNDYEKENKVQNEPKGGSESKLNAEQTQELIAHLQTNTYLLSKSICKYVKEKYNVEYSVPGMTAWLDRHGFVYKQPIKVPGKLNPEKQEAFIEEYEKLKASITKEEEILFLDAVHPEFQSKSVCGWIKEGEIKTLPTTSKQYRMHFMGAIGLKNIEVTVKEYKTINGENMIDFLKDLEKNSKASKIHIILDNGRSNKNKMVQEYLKTSKIELHYLPPYSPNLNSIERLWKVMRERCTYNKCYKTFADFSQTINKFFFEDIPKMAEFLTKRINDNFQRIKLNSIVVAPT
jgi:transposase